MADPVILSLATSETLASVNKSIYCTTTYMSSYKDPFSVKKSSLKSGIKKDSNTKRVRFSDDVAKYRSTPPENALLEVENINSNDGSNATESDTEQSKNDSARENVDEICRFCGKSKRRPVKLKYLDVDGNTRTFASSMFKKDNLLSSSTALRIQNRASWPTRNNGLDDKRPNYPRIIIKGYNDKPKCPILSSEFCECDKFPHLRESILKAEALAKRRAASFARRNYTTISVFHLLKHEPSGAEGRIPKRDHSSDTITKEPRISEWNRDYKSDANRKFYERFPDGVPDLRDSRRNVRRIIFCGHRSQVLR